MKIIIGLGNPGKKYENTRHNAGFMAVDFLVEKQGQKWEHSKKFQAESCKAGDTIYVKPQTFMNNSGSSAQAILAYYKLLPKKIKYLPSCLGGLEKNVDLSNILTLIHDDLDIDLGKIKKANNSRSAGHRGVESIIKNLKSKNFQRIRIGIRTPFLEKIPSEKFVLQKFSKQELEIIKKLFLEIKT